MFSLFVCNMGLDFIDWKCSIKHRTAELTEQCLWLFCWRPHNAECCILQGQEWKKEVMMIYDEVFETSVYCFCYKAAPCVFALRQKVSDSQWFDSTSGRLPDAIPSLCLYICCLSTAVLSMKGPKRSHNTWLWGWELKGTHYGNVTFSRLFNKLMGVWQKNL